MVIGIILSVARLSAGQAGDLGAQIAAQDAALGTAAGQIHITASGTISEGEVSLSTGHNLVCDDQVTISLAAGSYLYLNSHTQISNCIISSTTTPIKGEIQSLNADHVELHGVTFVGGGNTVYWEGVTDFVIADTKIVSITATDPATMETMSGIFLMKCARGQVNTLSSGNFVFPVGTTNGGILRMDLSSEITVSNLVIQNVDASFTPGVAAIMMNGSTHIDITRGLITNNANMDGILGQTYLANVPSSYLTISRVNSSFNGAGGLNQVQGVLGDGIDLINMSHVLVSHCTVIGSGSPLNHQPGIWIFIDDGVVIEDTEVSDGSTAGIAAAGSRNVLLLRDVVLRNKEQGVFAEFQGGTATNVGPEVTWVAGVSGGFGVSWTPGTPFALDGVNYPIASVTDNNHLTLMMTPPDHSSPVAWGVETTEDIRDSVINDNALAQMGGQTQVGISWADGTTGTISGVTSTNTGVGSQLYGLEFANTAWAYLDQDNFSGNLAGGDGISGSSQFVPASILSFGNQAVGIASLAQTVTFTAGAVVVQNLVIQASTNFSQSNNCSAALPAFESCQITLTFTPTAAGTLNGTLTITDNAPNSPLVISLTGTGISQGAGLALGLGIATGGSNSATVTAGAVANYSLSIGGTGASGTASLTCTGAPQGATCNVPVTVAINAAQATPLAVRVATRAPSMGAIRPTDLRPTRWLWSLALLGCVVLPTGVNAKRSARRYPARLLLLLLMFLCSCGGSTSRLEVGGTPKGTYNLTVTANFAGTTENLPLTLVVQ
jgi:Right handed beta helix region/Abnormal spindle-like microcephaly-assoc'd, ASPM-SPD-2-Hydin